LDVSLILGVNAKVKAFRKAFLSVIRGLVYAHNKLLILINRTDTV